MGGIISDMNNRFKSSILAFVMAGLMGLCSLPADFSLTLCFGNDGHFNIAVVQDDCQGFEFTSETNHHEFVEHPECSDVILHCFVGETVSTQRIQSIIPLPSNSVSQPFSFGLESETASTFAVDSLSTDIPSHILAFLRTIVILS